MILDKIKKWWYQLHPERTLKTYFDVIVDLRADDTLAERAAAYVILWRAALSNKGAHIHIIEYFESMTGIERRLVIRYLFRQMMELHRKADLKPGRQVNR